MEIIPTGVSLTTYSSHSHPLQEVPFVELMTKMAAGEFRVQIAEKRFALEEARKQTNAKSRSAPY